MKKQPTRKPVKKGPAVSSRKRSLPWFSIAIVAFCVLLYGNTLRNGFVLDDKGIITANRFTEKGFAGIPDLLTSSYWEGVGINVRSYRPLAPVSFAAEVGIWGENPAVSHFVNLLLYILTGLILLSFLKRLFTIAGTGIPGVVPFLVTALFLAHPVHTEVVANIKSRDTMLEFLFLILSAHFLLRYISTRSRRDLFISVAAWFPALLSKESALTYLAMVPVLLVLFDRESLVAKARTTLWYFIPAALFLLLYFRYSGQKDFAGLHLLDNSLIVDAPAAEIWATKFLILGKYLWLLLFPGTLVYDYSYNTVPLTAFSNPYVWFSLVIYLFMAVVLLTMVFRALAGKPVNPGQKIVTFSLAWFFMGFFASSNLVMLIGSTMGERFMYTSSLAFVLLVVYRLYGYALAAGKQERFEGTPALAVFVFCALVAAGYTWKTIDRNKAWKDDFTLFSTDLPNLPGNAKAHDFLANLYRQQGDSATDPALKKEHYLKAIELKEKAISIYPKVPEIQQQLAFLYGNTGQFDKSVKAYRVAIGLNPGEVTNYVQIGKALGMTGLLAEALSYLKQGEKLDPGNVELLNALGITYAQTGNVEKAVDCFEKVLVKDPSNRQAAGYLAYARQQLAGKKK